MNNQNTRKQQEQNMGPPSKRKTKRQLIRNWSSQLGFLFFTTLFLTLFVHCIDVNADEDDAARFDPSSTSAPNNSSNHFGLNITGKSQTLSSHNS